MFNDYVYIELKCIYNAIDILQKFDNLTYVLLLYWTDIYRGNKFLIKMQVYTERLFINQMGKLI